MALTRAGGHLCSAAVCGCQFMPLTGVMAHGDQRLPVPGHPGVHLQAAAETSVDVALIGNVLGQRGPAAGVPDPGDPGVTSGDPGVRSGDPARGRVLQLTVRGYGEARQQQARLRELIAAWDAAGRPGPGHLRIDAYHSGVMPPDTGDIVHVTPHATVVISSSPA